MSKHSGHKGTNVSNKDNPKLDPANGIQPAENEFAPHVDNNGDGTHQIIYPAKTPEPSMKPEAEALSEEDFLDYVKTVLKPEAAKLGYSVDVTKVTIERGPTMRYHRDTREGRVFDSEDQADPDYMSIYELRDLQNDEREAAEGRAE